MKKLLIFLILALPVGAFASYRVDYNCSQQDGKNYGLAIGSLRNELKFNGAMGAYLKDNSCNGEGQCVFISSADEKVEYWIDQTDYDASQRYNQCMANWAANRGSAPISASSIPDCGFSDMPPYIKVIEKRAGEVFSYDQCLRRDIPATFDNDPQE